MHIQTDIISVVLILDFRSLMCSRNVNVNVQWKCELLLLISGRVGLKNRLQNIDCSALNGQSLTLSRPNGLT